MRRHLLAPLAVVTLLAGCPDDPDSGGPTLSAATVTDFCRSSLTLDAEGLVECREVTPEVRDVILASADAEFCRVLADSVAAGRITYSPPAGAACLAAMDARTCVEQLRDDVDPSCSTPFTGTVPNAGACTLRNDCANGWCDASATCPGVCTAWLGEGDGCFYRGECGPGLVCGFQGTCGPVPPPASEGQSCETADCALGLTCAWPSMTCLPEGSAGAACFWSGDCRPGFGCAANDTCQPYLAAGSNCGTPDTVCIPGTSCVSGVCRLLPRVGEPCDLDERWCLDSWCDAGTCRAPVEDGASCTEHVCGPGSECVFPEGGGAGTCEPIVCP
jgi:hypothetical protein